MARSRTDLHNILKGLVGVSNAYFQPGQNVTMTYPCIVYNRNDSFVLSADNLMYWLKKKYSVMVIDRNPDSLIPDQVESLPFTRFDRFYIVDGLNHTVFNLYF